MNINDDISFMLGKTFDLVYADKKHIDGHKLVFETNDGIVVKFYHEQSCCEDVSIEDIAGDLEDLCSSPIVMAECVSDRKDTEDGSSQTWSFYKFATVKGYVTVRWLGTSNGYYSERVDMAIEIPDDMAPAYLSVKQEYGCFS